MAVIRSLLRGIRDGGGALVLRGDPGIGKSRLLEEGSRLAREDGIAVLSTIGVEAEVPVPFAGLHQLLWALRGRIPELPPAYRTALEAALGLAVDGPPDPFRIAAAVLDLLSEAASEQPLLIVVEDAHWVDESTADALAFVARRLEADPVVLLAATRDGYGARLARAGLPELRVDRLTDTEAASLLRRASGELPPSLTRRVLAEAAGNPLALLELPSSAGRMPSGAAEAPVLPLSERLQGTFTSRLADLPADTRLVLLAAAMNESDDVVEALGAAGVITGRELDPAVVEPAVDAAVADLASGSLRFRHPLFRSSILQDADAGEHRRVHDALAEVLFDQPDRRVWHRTALVTGEHEDLAAELEAAARRAAERGAGPVALRALERAARLSPSSDRIRRSLAAAQLAFELGRPETASALLEEVSRLDPTPIERARATFIAEMVDSRPLGDPARSEALIAEAERAGASGDRTLQLDLLWLVAWRAWWVDPGPDARAALVAAARRLGDLRTADPRVVAIFTYANPFAEASTVLERALAVSRHRRADPDAARHLGAAAVVLGAFEIAGQLLAWAGEGLRAHGRVGHLPRMLVLQGHVASRRADFEVAVPASEECLRLAAELGDPLWIAGAQSVAAGVAAMRGDDAAALAAAEAAERISLPAGANVTTAMAQSARAMAALGAGRYSDAFERARAMYDPSSPSYHLVSACWLVADMAEAGLHSGNVEEARDLLGRVESMVGDTPGLCGIGIRYARAVLADDDAAPELFEDALADDLQAWPYQRARLLTAYAQWLRRRRHTADSRAPLREARDIFDALGCVAWGDVARRELRASGELSPNRAPDARDQLTAHELHVAQLAAQGLSNREIAQRLFVSHRTVSTHLSRIYPKLGVRGRGELAAALTPR